MFLSVKGAKAGVINGESQDAAHANEIDVVSWSWGMQGRPTLGGGGAAGKAGKSALEYLKITIEQGRVTSIAIEGGDREQGTDVFENVTFSFNKITVEYVPQGKDGQPRGSMMFADQFDEQV